MTAIWIILFCIGFMMIAGGLRGQAGVAVGDTAVLVLLLGGIAIADLLLSRFLDTGSMGWWLAALLAFGFALDALYGLMAPTRQRHRDQRLRALMQGKRA